MLVLFLVYSVCHKIFLKSEQKFFWDNSLLTVAINV